ncbi:hypothetical protein FB451DRAFT_1047272, partial [Mycena latifolia]
ILDREGRIIGVSLGAPEDPDWPEVIAKAIKAMKKAREEVLHVGAVTVGDMRHRHRSYHTLWGGYLHGRGQKCPGMLSMSPLQCCIFRKLIRNKYVHHVCGLQSSGFRTFGPKMFKRYVNDLKVLCEHIPGLRHNFMNSIFPAVTFNLGPEAVAFEHLDFHNNPFGWCGITSTGDFNPRTSTHLYLKQLKLVVKFPSGASALIPSAIIDHGNTPLSPSETRCSIMQYAAGGLFRYVKYGFKTAKQLLAQSGGHSIKVALDGAPGERTKWGLELFSKLDELVADHAASF